MTHRGSTEDESLFRQLLENTQSIFFFVSEGYSGDTPGRILYISPGYETIWGRPREELFHNTRAWVDSIHPEDRERLAAALPGLAWGDFDQQFRIVRPDGEVRWVHDRVFPIRGDHGEVRRVAGMVEDITARKQAEAALHESEERFRQLANTVPSFVWIASPDGSVDYLNDRWYAYTGHASRQALGFGWTEAVHPEDRERTLLIWESARRREGFYEVEMRYRRKDGEYRWFMTRAEPRRDASGQVVSWFGTGHDVHDRKLAEEAKDRFLATLSHELRTPLTPVLAVTASLEEDLRLPADVRSALAMVRRNVELEARLIDDLLDLTRIAKGKLQLQGGVTDARRILEHAVETSTRDLEAKGVRLVTGLAAESALLWADAPRLTQVFWNLLQNACKFTPAGGTVWLRSRLEEDGEPLGRWIAVEVSDTGIGIEPELLPRIFDAFEQGRPDVTRRFGGLGLGLAISQAIVELHGGILTAASEGPGRGATFTVRLPLRDGVPQAAPEPESPKIQNPQSLHLLLVEDHADTSEAMAELLRAMGHRVKTAGTVAEARAAAAEAQSGADGGRIDLVVSDLGLPDGNGFDLMRELSTRFGLKGVALSGYGMEEDVRRSREAGFERHLTKPISPQALRAVIREIAETGG
jgi:PAS domain S-box-containing protein